MLKLTDLPEKFILDMKNLLGSEFNEYADSLSKEHNRGLRLNTGKVSDTSVLKTLGVSEDDRVFWTQNGYYIEGETKLSLHPYYAAGLFYLQEPSAMAPASLLPVDKTDRVLDLCAAPGGKSTELSNKAAFLHSNDISATRAQALLKNLELFGADNIMVTAEDPLKLKDYFAEAYDKILIDAPCSGEGMFRKDTSLIAAYIDRGPDKYCDIQVSVLNSAYEMLKKGGLMLYSTCTFSETEDEAVIDRFLSAHSDMELVSFFDFPQNVRYKEILEKVKNKKSGFEQTLKFFPHRVRGEGHFLALMQKKGDRPENPVQLSGKKTTDIFSYNYEKNKQLYRLLDDTEVIQGIRYIRTGLYVGECRDNSKKGGRIIIPSQALAMSLKPSEYPAVLNMPLEDDRVLRYLKGETLQLTGDESSAFKSIGEKYVLVAVDSFSLGFAAWSGDRLKNLYPRGWVRK